MKRLIRNVSMLLIAWPIFGTGCQQHEKVTVSGAVRYRNEPLSDGVVQFVNPGSAPQSAAVVDGSYRLESNESLSPGTYKVRLYGYRETGRTFRNPDKPTEKESEVVGFLPPTYNEASNITVELVAGENTKDFDLH